MSELPVSGAQRWAVGLEYNGSKFVGWQAQAGQRSVQSTVEAALTKVANHPVTVYCAGRTDAGVHALEQVVHFDSHVDRSEFAWLMGGNAHLPEEIRLLWVKSVPADFHARFSAIARYYRYIILNRSIHSAFYCQQMTFYPKPLDEQAMHRAAQALLGEQDFSSFRAQSCQSVSPFRLMHFIKVSRQNDQVHIELCANAFLHHMVRNIVGVLMEIGQGRRPENWTRELLDVKDRRLAAKTAAPDGLYLGGVLYPAESGLPKQSVFESLPSTIQRFIN